jgi:short-subunit dehydrogenase
MGQNNKKRSGVVVNIASISGFDPVEIFPIYSGIKHAVVEHTKAFGL